jgi:hypothetical protein
VSLNQFNNIGASTALGNPREVTKSF